MQNANAANQFHDMKKFYLMTLLCFMHVLLFAQSTTVTLYSTGLSGSYTTGNATSAARVDDNIRTTSTTRRGYAVFNLNTLPPGATITSCVIGFDVNTYGGSGTPSGWTTYGYTGDLSTVTTPATLFAAMVSGSTLSTDTYGTGVANQTLASTAATCTFIGANIGSKISICWTGGGTRNYLITGEIGTATTTGAHAPYLQITYTCAGVSGVTASAAPNPVCAGAAVTLSNTGTGATSFSWAGPAGYSSTASAPTFTATTASAGVYTLTAYNSAGCGVVVNTSSLVVNAAPAAISGASLLCLPSTATLSDASGPGTWVSVPTSVATINSAGVVSSIAPGTAIITYTQTSTGCTATKTVTVDGPPAAITGPGVVCAGSSITLSDATAGGTWSIAPTSVAAISSSGVVTGVSAGTATVTYTQCSTQVTAVVSVTPLPAAITGPSSVCEGGATITLSYATSGGSWASSDPARGSVSGATATTGVITGVAAGTITVTYTSLGCSITKPLTVNPLPLPIAGVLKQCSGGGITTLSDAIPGGAWGSSNVAIASISPTGVVTGFTAGVAIITYSNACGYVIALDTSVAAPGHSVGEDSACVGATTSFANAISGGSWASSNTAIATVLPGSGLITGIAPGKAGIIYMLPLGCFRTDTVTIVAGPPAITGPLSVCPGGTVLLSDAAPGSGSWHSSRPYIATIGASSGIVTGVATDTVTIIYAAATGCIVTTAVTVNPTPLPISVLRDTLCATLKDTVYDATPGGIWSSATPAIASVSAYGVITTLTGGNAVISYTIPATGCAVKKTIKVWPQPAPSIQYDNWTITLFTDTGFAAYQWYNSVAGAIAGAIYPSTAAVVDGTYYVSVTDKNGCVGRSANIAFAAANVGVSNTVGNKFINIYPNPVNNILHIAASEPVNADLAGIDGKLLIHETNASSVSCTGLPAGVYMLRITDAAGKEITTQKIIKE